MSYDASTPDAESLALSAYYFERGLREPASVEGTYGPTCYEGPVRELPSDEEIARYEALTDPTL
jgi:hypothetical protein